MAGTPQQHSQLQQASFPIRASFLAEILNKQPLGYTTVFQHLD